MPLCAAAGGTPPTVPPHPARYRHPALARPLFALSAEHIAQLDGGGARVTRRLKALYEHEFVERPLPQLVQLMTTGSAPLVYALTREGAKILQDIDGDARAMTGKSARSLRLGRKRTCPSESHEKHNFGSCPADRDVRSGRAATKGERRDQDTSGRIDWLVKPTSISFLHMKHTLVW